MYTLRDIIDHIDAGKTFSCIVVSFNRKKKEGGQLIEYDELRVLRPDEEIDLGRPKTKTEALKTKLDKIKRNPDHRKWFTRNVRIYQQGHPTGMIRKIHLPLIVEFNGSKDIAV